MIDYESIAKQNKLLGYVQLVVLVMLFFSPLFDGFHALLHVFVNYVPKHRLVSVNSLNISFFD